MNKVNTFFSVLLISGLFVGCGSNNDTTDVKGADSTETTEGMDLQNENKEPNVEVLGTIQGGANQVLILEANTDRGPVQIAQTTVQEDGSFEMEGAIVAMGLYQLRVDEKTGERQQAKAIPLTLVPEDKVKLETSLNEFNSKVRYEGTEWAPLLNGYMDEMNTFIKWQKTIQNPQQMDRDKLMKLVNNKKKPIDDYTIEQIKKDPDNPAHILLMTNLLPMMGMENYNPENIKSLQKLHKAYEESYPENPMTVQIGTQVAKIQQELEDFDSYTNENTAPEIALPNPDGEVMKLSSLRGNYVLIDFWASWCAPCRRENPNVVRLYKKYSDENFEIFSVSLDGNKENWKKAIKKDNLIWDYHVSDLKKWKSDLISKYQFRGIPHTVLIDPEGKIIEEKLRGAALEQKLKELFGK